MRLPMTFRISRFFVFALVAMSFAVIPPSAQAQKRSTIYKPNAVPKAVPADRALLWFRLAKHSTHKWKMDAKIGLGALFGNVGLKQTDEKVPLKKPLWPTIQIAPFDVKVNEFAGKGESAKSVARSMTKAFYVGPKRFVFEDENFRHYLVAVKSGTYVIGGTPSTCFCWGSKRFTVEAGRAYNMGKTFIASENGLSFWPDYAGFQTAADLTERGLVTDTMKLDQPMTGDMPPEVIGQYDFGVVAYEDAALFGNHYGRLVNRMIPDDWQPGQAFTLEAAGEGSELNSSETPLSVQSDSSDTQDAGTE